MMNLKSIFSIVFLLFLISCTEKKTGNIIIKKKQPAVEKLAPALFISGDFNGDKATDTIFESYQSSITHKEISKLHDSINWDNDLDLTIKSKPVTTLYSSDKSIEKFMVSDHPQQKGVYLFANLGDINDDGKDEFGYAVDWADFSSLNTYHIMTLKQGSFIEIFQFPIHESMSIPEGKDFDPKDLIKKTSKKTIRYNYVDLAEVDIRQALHTFK
ncbi:MAG: hypothetical protein QM710_03645 [Flavobacterium sp.]